MAALITTEQAMDHLRVYGDEYVNDVELKMEQATALVITYLKRPDHTWTVATDPSTDSEFAIVQGAILEVLANIYYDRGDNDKPTVGPLTPRIKNSLAMLRDPALR